jgi:hypothetical protein
MVDLNVIGYDTLPTIPNSSTYHSVTVLFRSRTKKFALAVHVSHILSQNPGIWTGVVINLTNECDIKLQGADDCKSNSRTMSKDSTCIYTNVSD